ncbi:MAG: TonB-dependent receptor [Fusobacterium sp.]|uniref:TonB-dependent receptor n=1 Tax=Fusobacterium sp. TaxID=68766 RepID=UPI0026DD6032|nr:TonB-dependent receptor [Fusobacterium sp.]MDO4691140.1 TonB-dependent receptor [Fusobacterium sp.]
MKKRLMLLSLIACCAASYATTIDLGKTDIYSETGYKTNLRNSVSSPYIITAKEIEEKKFTTVSEILASIPKVTVKDGDLPQIDVRGQGYQKARATVQLLVDGIPANMLDTSHMNVPVNMVNPKEIERIEVIPGGGAVLYGSGTAGGVINIITKRNKGTYGSVGYQVGSYSNHKFDASLGTSIDKFDVGIDYSKNKKDGYRDREESDSDYFSGKVTYNINETDNIALKYSGFRNDYLPANALTETQLKENRKQSGVKGVVKEEHKIKKDEFSLIYNNKLGDKNHLNLVAFYQNTELPSEKVSNGVGMRMGMLEGQKKGIQKALMNPMLPPRARAGMNAQISRIDAELNSLRAGNKVYFYQKSLFKDTKTGIKIKNKFNYAEGSNLILGFGYTDNDMKRDSLLKFINADYSDRASMADIKISLSKKTYEVFGINTYRYGNFEFTQGLRYENSKYDGNRKSNEATTKINKSVNNVAGTLAVNYLYSPTGNIYAKYERAFTSPAPGQLVDKVRIAPKSREFKYVVNDLKTEKTNLFELGWNDYLLNSLISASVYLSETRDEIATVFDGGVTHQTSGFASLNIGKTRRYGFDLKAEQQFDKFRISESYSYINTKIVENKDNKAIEGKKILGVPAHKLMLSLDYDVTEKLAVGASYEYVAASYIENTNKYGKDDNVSLFNLRANYKINENFDIYAGIKNVFDRKYNKGVSLDSSTGEKLYEPAARRNYYAGFSYKF